jgi:hypothetical protein
MLNDAVANINTYGDVVEDPRPMLNELRGLLRQRPA